MGSTRGSRLGSREDQSPSKYVDSVRYLGLRMQRSPRAPPPREPGGAYARVIWEARFTLAPGGHEISCRAIDSAGTSQPADPVPNVRGYGNYAVHRVSVRAA